MKKIGEPISVFEEDSQEYRNLQLAASMMNFIEPAKNYMVRQTYFDFGQKWMWTTLLAYDSQLGAYQALTPRDQEDILSAEGVEEIWKAIQMIYDRKL